VALRPLLRPVPSECQASGVELLEFAQLADRAGSVVETLSGGMKRRLSIARSLINNPSCCCSTSPPPASTRRRATCCGTACTG
jgi:ABC-type methionine transport system ATPase subunit